METKNDPPKKSMADNETGSKSKTENFERVLTAASSIDRSWRPLIGCSLATLPPLFAAHYLGAFYCVFAQADLTSYSVRLGGTLGCQDARKLIIDDIGPAKPLAVMWSALTLMSLFCAPPIMARFVTREQCGSGLEKHRSMHVSVEKHHSMMRVSLARGCARLLAWSIKSVVGFVTCLVFTVSVFLLVAIFTIFHHLSRDCQALTPTTLDNIDACVKIYSLMPALFAHRHVVFVVLVACALSYGCLIPVSLTLSISSPCEVTVALYRLYASDSSAYHEFIKRVRREVISDKIKVFCSTLATKPPVSPSPTL